MPASADSFEAYRGTFHLGHTSDEAASVLSAMSRDLGWEVCVVWAFDDRWGCGGDSELMVVDRNGRYCEAPDDLNEFLYEKNNQVDWLKLQRNFHPGRVRYRRELAKGEGLDHNYALKIYQGEAPRC